MTSNTISEIVERVWERGDKMSWRDNLDALHQEITALLEGIVEVVDRHGIDAPRNVREEYYNEGIEAALRIMRSRLSPVDKGGDYKLKTRNSSMQTFTDKCPECKQEFRENSEEFYWHLKIHLAKMELLQKPDKEGV